jgi:hypothetical protein
MAYMSARELLSGLPVKMAHGGPVHTPSGEPLYGKGATAADLLAAEQRVLGEIAADPSGMGRGDCLQCRDSWNQALLLMTH